MSSQKQWEIFYSFIKNRSSFSIPLTFYPEVSKFDQNLRKWRLCFVTFILQFVQAIAIALELLRKLGSSNKENYLKAVFEFVFLGIYTICLSNYFTFLLRNDTVQPAINGLLFWKEKVGLGQTSGFDRLGFMMESMVLIFKAVIKSGIYSFAVIHSGMDITNLYFPQTPNTLVRMSFFACRLIIAQFMIFTCMEVLQFNVFLIFAFNSLIVAQLRTLHFSASKVIGLNRPLIQVHRGIALIVETFCHTFNFAWACLALYGFAVFVVTNYANVKLMKFVRTLIFNLP